MTSLWGKDFEIDSTTEKTKSILKKISKPKKVITDPDKILKSKTVSIDSKLSIIRDRVNKILGKYAEQTQVIRDKQTLTEYINCAIKNGEIAIDTETNNSLDPLTCKLMGPCIYTPGQKSAYIPINHIDISSGDLLPNQLTEKDIKEEFTRLIDNNVKIIMHNGKFDYKVFVCTCDLTLPIYWDTMIGAKVLDENESAALKYQYMAKIDPSQEKYSIDKLFENIQYAEVEPELFALYAATDAYLTYKLYQYQINEFNKTGHEKLFNLFKTVEMPLVPCIAKMELTGVCIDTEYSQRLSIKYHHKLEETDKLINKELEKLSDQIEKWKSNPSNKTASKLSDPINLDSPTQLAILLYDILKTPPQSTKSPRGTGEDILKKIDNPLCKLVLERRGILKLLNTYIDKLPYCLSPRDNRLHGEFLQFGADTGRFSSKNPNLQNIPPKEESIRMMFTASPGYIMIGSDYSQQEPRILAHYSGDENMINAYKEGKDLYAMIASKVYKNNYEDNLEFNPITKQIQPDGKHRRSSVKSLLLGLMYGMGDKMTASRIGCSIDEAKSIRRDFFDSFPKVEKWISETQESAHKLGYVEDVWGRRRRLPDILKEKYEISSNIKTFNPILFSKGYSNKIDQLISSYTTKLNNTRNINDKNVIIKQANKDGLTIRDNSGFIAQAERQSVNARIQGGSATMSKRAIILIDNDEQLNSLGFRLLILVHDEVIGECPEENKEKVKKRLSELMVKAAQPEVKTVMKCDTSDFRSWYFDVYSADICEEYNKLQERMDNIQAIDKILSIHEECTKEQIMLILSKKEKGE